MEHLVERLAATDNVYNDGISKTESLKSDVVKEKVSMKLEYNSKSLLKKVFAFRDRENIENKEEEILGLDDNLNKIKANYNAEESNIKKIMFNNYLEANPSIADKYNISKLAFENADSLYEQGKVIKDSSDNIEKSIIKAIKSIQHSKEMEAADMISSNKGIAALSFISNMNTGSDLKEIKKSVVDFKTEVEKFEELSKKLNLDNNVKNIDYKFSILLDGDFLGALGSFLSYQNLSEAKTQAEASLENFQKEIAPNVNLSFNSVTETRNRIADVYMKNQAEIDSVIDSEFSAIKKQTKIKPRM